MSLAQQIKPISYLKSHAAEIIKDFATNPDPLIITQNGEAKMVVLDIHAYEQQQETMALLKLIAMGNQELAQGQFQDADDVFTEMAREE
jgi:prevent-host-death family protein